MLIVRPPPSPKRHCHFGCQDVLSAGSHHTSIFTVYRKTFHLVAGANCFSAGKNSSYGAPAVTFIWLPFKYVFLPKKQTNKQYPFCGEYYLWKKLQAEPLTRPDNWGAFILERCSCFSPRWNCRNVFATAFLHIKWPFNLRLLKARLG